MATGKKPRNLTPTEQLLWSKVVERVESLDALSKPEVNLPVSHSIEPAKKPKGQIKSFQLGQNAKGADLSAHRGATASQSPPQTSPNMDRRSFQRLLKGKLPIDGTIDLHGMTAEQAHAQLIWFVQSSHRSGKRLVLVITGKGKKAGFDEFNRPKIGVLKHGVPEWLKSAPVSHLVLQVAQAHNKHGGGGAYYVYLRRKR